MAQAVDACTPSPHQPWSRPASKRPCAMPPSLGYEVTVVRDATADYSRDDACCLDINIPNYVSAIVTTSQISAFIRPGVGRA